MQTDEMTQAMNTLKAFSEKQRAYDAYQARQNFLREPRSIQRALEEDQRAPEERRAEQETFQREKVAAFGETEAALQEQRYRNASARSRAASEGDSACRGHTPPGPAAGADPIRGRTRSRVCCIWVGPHSRAASDHTGVGFADPSLNLFVSDAWSLRDLVAAGGLGARASRLRGLEARAPRGQLLD
jgi:hypothetical protein